MPELVRHRTAKVWLALVVATIVSWTLGTHYGRDTEHTLATAIVLLVAFVKVRYVGLDFMELRRAPFVLRLCFESWVALVLTALVALYLATA